MLCVNLHAQEVSEPPFQEELMPECVFDENGYAVKLCFCSVACSVTVVFNWSVGYACAV